jgi:amino acid transporter
MSCLFFPMPHTVSAGIVFAAPGIQDGGPAVIIWGFLATFFCTTVIGFSMAEICAAYPSAGCVRVLHACTLWSSLYVLALI